MTTPPRRAMIGASVPVARPTALTPAVAKGGKMDWAHPLALIVLPALAFGLVALALDWLARRLARRVLRRPLSRWITLPASLAVAGFVFFLLGTRVQSDFSQVLSAVPSDTPAQKGPVPAEQPAADQPATATPRPVSPPVPPPPQRPAVEAQPAATLPGVDAAIAAMVPGYVQYLAPDALAIGSAGKVTLELGRFKEEVTAAIDRLRRERGGQTGGGELRIGPVMRAQLTGSGFKVTPSEAVEQWISATEPSIWNWDIEAVDGDDWFPRLSARRDLSVSIDAVLTIDGAQHRRLINTWSRTITVTVSWPLWLHKGVEAAKDFWWVAAAVIGIAGLVLRRKWRLGTE